jgi:hypothetical protein
MQSAAGDPAVTRAQVDDAKRREAIDGQLVQHGSKSASRSKADTPALDRCE